nr:GTP-binding protein [Paenibacillus bovis]
MKQTKVIIISGFLGAGKTSLMVSAADQLRAKGWKVACITNDQGEQLVDTKIVYSNGFPIQQVQGGCFCCKFDNLVDTINHIVNHNETDVIFAEAVGSCTDIMATVIKPLEAFHGELLDIQPLTVVVDPQRFRDIKKENSIYTTEIAYLFEKQIEEAQYLLLNKADVNEKMEIEEINNQLENIIPFAKIFPTSAVNAMGVNEWLDNIFDSNDLNATVLDIDYDVYAKAEEQLGWLNSSISVSGLQIDVLEFANELLNKWLEKLEQRGAVVAHLKIWVEDENRHLKLSSVRNNEIYPLNDIKHGIWLSDKVDIWINARINIDYQMLKIILEEIKLEYKTLDIIVNQLDNFAPSRPVPTHRFV